jgi:predicted small lipoprotein YifL
LIQLSDQRWARLAVAGTLVAALGLSACGRKGPLDPPPSAAQYADPGPAAGGPGQAPPSPRVGVGRDGKAVAPERTKDNRPFILDWLVD